MSGELVREVLSLAPSDLTPSQLVILVVIAERAQPRARVVDGRDIPARECFPNRADMLRDCRMTEANLSKTLQRLAQRGLEVRVPLGTDRSGRPFYARSGHRTTYRLPHFTTRADQGPASGDGEATDDRLGEASGRTTVGAEDRPPSVQSRTTVHPEPGPGSDPKRNVTGTEPEREPGSDRWRDRGQRAASAADRRSLDSVPEWVEDHETAVLWLEEEVGADYAIADGIVSSYSGSYRRRALIARNTIEAQERTA